MIANLRAEQLSAFTEQLSLYGISVDDVEGQRLENANGGPIVLDTSGGPSAVQPKILTTTDLDEMRRWLNPAGDARAAMTRTVSTPFPYAAAAAEDAGEEYARLTAAAYDYIFHGAGFAAASPNDPGLKSAIEAAFSEMNLAVFAGETIVVRPGQPLIISGAVPVALNYAEMDIYTGGQVLIYAPGVMTIQVLKKLS
ncbi:hypothetical protein WMF28_06850 [Sorangium sp. So ce590]|uniref:hypothetical protein n=1 Tax=Sorangium sp. So ce590 TaxID=3133317 RepID=UPI003F63CAD3